ncbi:CAP domain-containing protein [Rhizobium sp. SSA_523]|uniref:CAP domain-containing protein n=1 Tax=Rhizobium sp. SSA_523 TaxID=2952477 RepID=UPI0020902E39|nr:CAP domain-containing protein [Rhizobium sp. SSA_523]MCO5732930.1 CAP domain-containing protein [Rhizobium sp. SSA_523]WKC23818.1 CAP domain-containing protein [Rhizobium sp. SSA_523]
MINHTLYARRGFLILAGGAVAGLAGCSTFRGSVSVDGATDDTRAALPLVNALRAKNSLGPLSPSGPTGRGAAEQAVRMARADQMTHLIGLGDDFGSRMKRSSVPLPAAENIASGQQDVQGAVQAWIDSKKHLENMLGSYTHVGVAVARSPSTKRPYWAMVLSA